jgi:predicted DNA-binding protein
MAHGRNSDTLHVRVSDNVVTKVKSLVKRQGETVNDFLKRIIENELLKSETK